MRFVTYNIQYALGKDQRFDLTPIAGPGDDGRVDRRIDDCFVSASLAGRVRAAWIDGAAQGSGHQPVWAELDL